MNYHFYRSLSFSVFISIFVFQASAQEAMETVIVVAEPIDEKQALPSASAELTPEERARQSENEEMDRLRRERDRLALENSLRQERLRMEMAEVTAERERLASQNALLRERIQQEQSELRAEIERMKIEAEKTQQSLSLRSALARQALEEELSSLRHEEERLKVMNSLASAQIDSQMINLRLQEAEFKNRRTEMEMELAELQAELLRRERQGQLRDQVRDSRQRLENPFQEGRLIVSDRRIPLNGPIFSQTADFVADRINFFNNESVELPVFIVIDYSPGGSVMAGYKILKAMKGSRAPVYVVVKQFAASMAAALTTLAEKSFAYPTAVILHHQLSFMGWGNLTQQRESLREAERWWLRLGTPIAEKMGISLDEFTQRMYAQNSDGDWREFADEAVKLGWVDHVVEEIWETFIDRNPDRFGSPTTAHFRGMDEERDAKNNPYVLLPRLAPFDVYYLYNPDNYYRMR